MSAAEFKLRKLIDDATYFISNADEDETYHDKAKDCLDEGEKILLENTRESYMSLSAEVIVRLAEVSLLSGKRDESAERILDIFFQRIGQEDQFFCQALLAYATIEERKIAKKEKKGEDNLKQVKHAFSYVQRAIEICTKAENKAKYQFLVYNASIKTWHIVRSLMRPGWSKFITDILEKLSNLLEEADDSDLNWRCRFLSALCKSLADSEKKPEALKCLDKLVDLTKKKGDCNFQEVLLRTRIHMYRDNNGVLANIKKETETGDDPNAYKYLYLIQTMQSEIVQTASIEKELQLLMSTIAPMSISDDPAVQAQASKLSPILQDRIAECGRIAIKHNLIQYAEGACAVVARARQGSLRAKVWSEYIKAELLLRKPSAGVDKKTGMKLNTLQRQTEDFERRVEALRVLDRAMIANKRLQDPDVIIEGCTLIWNTGLPFLKASARAHIYKPFQAAAAALEQIESNDALLRVCLHLELAKYEIEQDFLSKASVQLQKALKIDYSTVNKQLGFTLEEEDNPNDFSRPYDKALKFLLKKLSLKTNIYGGDPESVHEQVILDVENAKTTKNQKMRQMLLDKAVKALQDFEVPEFELDPALDLVEEEITAAKRKFMLQQVRERKERVLICSEISTFAMDEMLVSLSYTAATLGIAETWDAQKDADLVIAQSNCHIQLAKCHVEYLLEEDIEIGHKDLVTVFDDQDDREFTEQQKEKYSDWKNKFCDHIIKAVQLGQQAKQSWLIFNAAIEFWNNYLPILKKLDYFVHIHPSGTKAMAECFEAMNSAFVSGDFSQLDYNKVDYELDRKMNVFTNIAMQLARIYEYRTENQEAVRICDLLLTKQLPSHLRKTFDSIRAKVTKQVSKLSELAQTKAAPAKAAGKGQAPPTEQKEMKGPSKVDILTSEVLSYLELIQAGQKEMIQKAVDSLNLWIPSENEEIELELNVELWCRLGRLAINQATPAMYKVALYCADTSLKNGDSKIAKKQYLQIPVTRLRWYAVAEALYGEALYKLLDTQKQEKESQDRLLHASVARLVESCHIGSKAGIGYLVLESSKSMWNSMLGILDAPNNRRLLVEPMCKMHSYLLAVQENSDPDFLNLFYTAMFQVIAEQRDWKTGERIVEEAFKYMPNTHHKVLWEAKMNFLSKLGKNVLSAISNMKESNASLMAKVWVRLARSSQQELEQYQAYNKAIEILRKEESIEVVEVLIEYSEWMHRNDYNSQDVEDQLLLAVDLLMDIEPQGWDDEEDEMGMAANPDDEQKTRKTGKTSSSRNSKALTKKSKAGRSVKQSVAGKTTKSKMSKASMRSKSLKSSGTRVSKRTTTALSKRQEEDANPMFMNCSHFDKLIRVHSMLAMLAPDSNKQREYALDAHYFIMKMWEQSFLTLNATVFFENHYQQMLDLGFKITDTESRREYYAEVLTSSEFSIPATFLMPEKLEDWATFELPQEMLTKGDTHEDKVMIGKWTYMKPELSYLHLKKIADVLEGQVFSVQLIPVLQLLEVFASNVLQNPILQQTHALQRARLLMNLGLKAEGTKLYEKIEANRYVLTEEERKVQFEKIKALSDSSLKEDKAHFPVAEASEPLVIETVRIHESWADLGEELVKWGEFARAKDLAQEASLHSRILKDADCYAKSLLTLSTVAFVEGQSAQSLKIAMMSHSCVRDMQQLEKCVVHTFNILLHFRKFEDMDSLLTPLIEMLQTFRRLNNDGKVALSNTKANTETKKQAKVAGQQASNTPLEYAIATSMICQAIRYLEQSQTAKMLTIDEQSELLETSYKWCSQFMNQITTYGYRVEHTNLALKYFKLLQEAVNKIELTNSHSIEQIKRMMEQSAIFLLKVQELLTSQVYFIGVHQDSAQQAQMTLPMLRLLGITKLRIAQVNTTIGIVKTNLEGSGNSVIADKRKLDKIVSTFMDNITKQIDAQSATYNKQMNRYEKSISILFSALNLIHQHCAEYSEALVEVTKNRRYLAITKKHLRGQWRQDAIQVEEVNMQLLMEEEGKDRKETLEQRGLEGEIQDTFIDYKQEMLQGFIDLMDDKVGSDDKEDVSTYDRISLELGTGTNNLSTYALEFAEGRANLNKEQAFFYLALYQYAISREGLYQIYQAATTEKHRDERRKRALDYIRSAFSYFTSPIMPQQYRKVEEEFISQSKPLQIMRANFSIDYLKENLPGQSAYVSLQMSEDMSSLYLGYCQINKERKMQYYVNKVALNPDKRSLLRDLVSRLAELKTNMQKSPITIDEDLKDLQEQSEEELVRLMKEFEAFFGPILAPINDILNPLKTISVEENEVDPKDPKAKGKVDPKKPDPKAKAAAPAKGGKGGAKGAPSELAGYESTLPTTTAGIESIVVCVDRRLESLPFESLEAFDKVSVVSRDFNLHTHMQRLNQAGHKAELHNNQGLQKEELHYVIDVPNVDHLKTQSETLLKDLPAQLPGSQWQGLLQHKTHMASEGEWQKHISSSSLFMYFSMTCLLHQFPAELIAELSIFNQCKAMILFDRMNTFKTLIDRQMLTSKHFSSDEQPMQQVALFTLNGVNSIVTTNWAVTPESNFSQLEQLLRSTLSEGNYLGTVGLRKHFKLTETDALTIHKANIVTYGVPLLRVI